MSLPRFPRVRRILVRAAAGVGLLCVAGVLTGYVLIRGSLPTLDGSQALRGLGAPATIERDANGVPTIHAANPDDVCRVLGFLHGQDRFFQMDLMRRQAAGELSELFGRAALPLDRAVRRNRFAKNAPRLLATLEPANLRRLDAYVAGVNSGLASLRTRPWEYFVLRVTPRPWTREDSLMVINAMALSLQDPTARDERSRAAILATYGETVLNFLKPPVLAETAALDGTSAPAPAVPAASEWIPRPPSVVATSDAPGKTAAASFVPEWNDEAPRPGSNNFALAGARVTGGGALVANDMHLSLSVPNTWYRVSFALPGRTGSGTTLPGVPALVTGSNGDVAWGFTNSYIDSCDLVILETDPVDPTRYRVPDGDGWEKFETVHEQIPVAGGAVEPLEFRSTRWGPVVDGLRDGAGHPYATCWVGNDPGAINLRMMDLFDARTVDEAVEIAHHARLPTQNFVVGDRAGNIAWTLIGPVPRRIGFDGRLPQSWGDGTCRWDGFVPPEQIPTVRNPPGGQLWTANNRVLGGDAFSLIGDGGTDYPARAAQIRDRLAALSGRGATPADGLAVQLDDESRFLARWRALLTEVLTDEAVAGDPPLAELRRLLSQWHGHAAVDEPGYRLVRDFRRIVIAKIMDPIMEPVRKRDPEAYPNSEQAVWSILAVRPAYLLPLATGGSWDVLLIKAARETARMGERQKGGKIPLRDCTWGRANTLAMQHPFSRILPGFVGRFLDMPAVPLPGDNHMPRVQNPGFGASERMVVTPGRESEGIYHQPGGVSGNPLSPFYRAGHDDWASGRASSFLPGPMRHQLVLSTLDGSGFEQK